MNERKKHISELKDMLLFQKNESEHTIDLFCKNFRGRVLNNILTKGHCDIVECIHNDSGEPDDEWVGRHEHKDSQEVFYQVAGITYFDDNTALAPGQFKIIKQGESHALRLGVGSVTVVIIHPPLKELER